MFAYFNVLVVIVSCSDIMISVIIISVELAKGACIAEGGREKTVMVLPIESKGPMSKYFA